jgi:mono/diheme cytochrome c family protein
MKQTAANMPVQGVLRPRVRLVSPLLLLAASVWVSACAEDNEPGTSADAGSDAADTQPSPEVDAEAEADATEPVRTPFVAANSLPDDDPRKRGEQLWLYSSWNTGVLSSMPPADFLVGLMETEPEVFGEQFAAFGFVADPSRDLPIGLATDTPDSQGVVQNCALCHVSELPDGRLWLGAPNTRLRLGEFRVAVNERWVAAGNESLLSELAIEKFSQLGSGRFNAESDDYPRLVPADFPVYFRLGERNDLNYMGTGQNVRTEVYFALFTSGCGNPNDETAVVAWPSEADLVDLVDFMSTIEPPDAPPGDDALISRGEQVFGEARCNTCHILDDALAEFVVPLDATEGGIERIPGDDLEWPRGSVRTSSAHRILQDGDGEGGGVDDGFADLLNFIITRGLTVRQTDGYRTNSLLGLWATAPYLHNGSVPTLEDLLKPAAERPVRWMQGDVEIDTTRFGFDNAGHEFGTDLSPADKEALLAFLRSL